VKKQVRKLNFLKFKKNAHFIKISKVFPFKRKISKKYMQRGFGGNARSKLVCDIPPSM